MHAAKITTSIDESLIVLIRKSSTGKNGAGCLRSCQTRAAVQSTAVAASAMLGVESHAKR